MNNLRVLQITDSLNVGGTEVLAVNMANIFLEHNIESFFCTTRQEGSLKQKLHKNVNYIFLKKKHTIDIIALFRLRKFTKIHKINIIHVHSTSLFFGVCLKLLCPKIKLIWHNHTGANFNLKGFKFYFIKYLSKFAFGIINVNEDLNIWSKEKIKHKNTIKLYNFPFFTDNQEITKLKGEVNKRVVCLAALRPEKDHITLIKAFKTVLKYHPTWTLHLVGKDYNDIYSKKLKSIINKRNLNNNVFLYNMCLDIKNILKQSTIGVLSSVSEGLPISLLEYGLANLPVLTTDVGDCKKVLNNNKAVVPSKKSSVFAERLSNIIEDEFLRKELSRSLNDNVISIYSKEKFMSNLNEFYNN